jgi:hypothetical protein
MPQPAPPRFDAADRRALHGSLLTALGPTLVFAVLTVGYALSAHVCQPNMRTIMALCVALGAIGSIAAAWWLVQLARAAPDHAANRRLRPAAIGLQVFCLLVILAYGIALTTMTPCG